MARHTKIRITGAGFPCYGKFVAGDWEFDASNGRKCRKNSVLEKGQEKDQKEEEQDKEQGKEQELQKYQYPDLEEKPSHAELIQATGGWVQAVGSVISLIGQLRSNQEENSGEGSSNESNSDDG